MSVSYRFSIGGISNLVNTYYGMDYSFNDKISSYISYMNSYHRMVNGVFNERMMTMRYLNVIISNLLCWCWCWYNLFADFSVEIFSFISITSHYLSTFTAAFETEMPISCPMINSPHPNFICTWYLCNRILEKDQYKKANITFSPSSQTV